MGEVNYKERLIGSSWLRLKNPFEHHVVGLSCSSIMPAFYIFPACSSAGPCIWRGISWGLIALKGWTLASLKVSISYILSYPPFRVSLWKLLEIYYYLLLSDSEFLQPDTFLGWRRPWGPCYGAWGRGWRAARCPSPWWCGHQAISHWLMPSMTMVLRDFLSLYLIT